jgi:hypothetical protein
MALRTQSGNLIARSNNVANVASQNLFAPNSERSGLQVSADKDLTYLLLYSDKDGSVANNPTASATAWDIVIPAGGSWPGTIGGVVWTGGAAVISAAATGRVAYQET